MHQASSLACNQNGSQTKKSEGEREMCGGHVGGRGTGTGRFEAREALLLQGGGPNLTMKLENKTYATHQD